jgi:DNA-binding transcriptional regulator/RsmH inhibitor MraZ
MRSINLPHLLGERGPAAAQARRAIRRKLLARRSLAPADHEAIRHLVSNLLSEAAALRDQLRDNPKDEQKRRLCRALIAEAVYLASDDEGRHVLWLIKMCTDLILLRHK